MNYLITGGSGFVGSLLCESLVEKGHKVINLDIIKPSSDSVKFYNINILNKTEVDRIFVENKIDIIIHSCAEVPITKSKDFFKVNLGGTKNIIDCFLKFKIKN
ncbi:NAD-dependent epimerase/dehydratase family protein [Pelagibacterales bacterium SAG-MED02]|nr:NAD-dependent epimerase/dehydratase family protein [Pelagibacterales bacterium SAG-MED02]